MSSPLGWPAHGCATELFIPLDYTRCDEPRRTDDGNDRKLARRLCEPRLPCYRARIVLSGIDARNPTYFALLRDIEQTITRTTYIGNERNKGRRKRDSFLRLNFLVRFSPYILSFIDFYSIENSGY